MRRWAGAAVAIAALWMGVVSGCTQLLGVADITADQDVSRADGGDDGSPGVDLPPAGGDGGSSSDGGDARSCGNDLSNAFMLGFYVSFTMQTRQPDGVIALLNQRDQCTLSDFWDLQLVNHKLYFEIADPKVGDATVLGQGAPLNDDVAHSIVVSRQANGLVQLTIDRVLVGSATLHQSLGPLPMLRVGTSVCVGEDPSVAFVRTISNVCLGLQ
jgi:hypothetical protein